MTTLTPHMWGADYSRQTWVGGWEFDSFIHNFLFGQSFRTLDGFVITWFWLISTFTSIDIDILTYIGNTVVEY